VIRVTAFTGGWTVPSARFRVRQLVPALREAGVDLREWPAPLGSYPPPSRSLRPAWALATLGARLPGIAWSHRSDVTLLQREMLSTFVTLEPLTRRPRVLDVDDAIFLWRGGRFAERLARSCESVVCGNAYLAERFGAWNSRVEVLPTSVDTARYRPAATRPDPDKVVIGWMGTSSNFPYLYGIEPALGRVLGECREATLLVVADRPPRFASLPADRVEYRRWRADLEVEVLRAMTVGIMPLADSSWERGKCSLKMLLYMACEVPVVASPVGMNADVLARGDVGIGATSEGAWVEALMRLLRDRGERERMGTVGRAVVRDHYSVERIAPRLAAHLRAIAG
jgi:glycosyltransferase involved in cell wall biosynthesis